MLRVGVKALVCQLPSVNQRALNTVFSVSSYILVLRFCVLRTCHIIIKGTFTSQLIKIVTSQNVALLFALNLKIEMELLN